MRKKLVRLIFVLTAALTATWGSAPAMAAPSSSLLLSTWSGERSLTSVTYRRRYYEYYGRRVYYRPRYYTRRIYEYVPPVVYYPPPVVYYPAPVVRYYAPPPVAYDDVDVDVYAGYGRPRIEPYYAGW